MPWKLPRAGRKHRIAFQCAPCGAEGSASVRAGAGRAMAKRTFRIILIKPSHYDDDGYVIQWRRSTIPSNSLASVHGLLANCAEEQALGPDVDIEIETYDETQHGHRRAEGGRADKSRRQRICRPRRRSVEPVSSRPRSRAQVPRGRRARRDRRIPCLGLHIDASRPAAGSERSAGFGRHPLRRRGRGADHGPASRHRLRTGRSRFTITSTTCPAWRRPRSPCCLAKS